MAISTYSEVLSAAQNWLARSDADIQSRIPEFIALTEEVVTWGSDDPEFMIPRVRARQMEQRATATVSSEYTALPTDFLEMRQVKLNTDPTTYLSYITPQEFDQRYVSSLTGKPTVFTIVGSEMRVGPTPDTSYTAEMWYYKTIPALTVSNTTNWLLSAAPGVYLYGVMFHAAPYVQAAGVGVDADLASDTLYWYRQFASRVNALNKSSQMSQYGGTLTMRPAGDIV